MENKVRILSIDGGGIRGIIPATVLQYVEEKLIKLSGNEDARLADFFDLIVGTSTGGILTCFYLTPNPSLKNREKNAENNIPVSKYPAAKALEFYVEKGNEIFTKSRNESWLGIRQLFNATKYRENNIEAIFNEEFSDLKMSELLKPCMITSYNMVNQSAVFFKSRNRKSNLEYRVKDVVRSTSAAPTGGGRLKLPELKKSGKWGVINWAHSAPEIMMDGAADTVDYQLKAIFGTLDENNKKHYKRVNVPFDKRKYSYDMSDASDKNITELKKAGEEALEDARKNRKDELNLDEFIKLLIE